MQNKLEARDFSPDQSPEPLIHPPKPPVNKRYRAGRTCRNCVNAAAPGGLCLLYQDSDTRNPRARALRCRMFEHWNDAFDNILADTLRKS